VRNCLKKKSDENQKVNQVCEDQEQMFVAALSVNDHTTYDWIIDSNATQHMTFKRKWFTTYKSIVPRKVYMGDGPFWKPLAKGASRPQCKLEVECYSQPSLKLFMFSK